jgi:nicotinate dehydrogenase subunit A
METNLCRCGTHMRILRAVSHARDLMKSKSAAATPAAQSGRAS